MKKLIKIKLDNCVKTDDGMGISLSEGGKDVVAGQIAYDVLMYPAPSLLRKLSGAEKKRMFKLALKIKAAQTFVELEPNEVTEVVAGAWEKYTPLVAGAFEESFQEYVPTAPVEVDGEAKECDTVPAGLHPV